jgi:tRNA(Ile)-lysidine synthase
MPFEAWRPALAAPLTFPTAQRAAALLTRLEISGGRATLSRTVIERRPDGLYLHRESRGLPRLRAVEAAVWDGRFKILAGVPKPAPEISPCGRADTPEWAPPSPQPPRRLIRAALSAEPAIWEGDRFLGLAREHPALRLERLVSPFARFLGEFDLSLAQALSDLIGATPPPVSPWADHNPA